MRTDLPICRTCGVQYGAPREDCPVCLDERQYVGWGGRQWVTLAELARREQQAPGTHKRKALAMTADLGDDRVEGEPGEPQARCWWWRD